MRPRTAMCNRRHVESSFYRQRYQALPAREKPRGCDLSLFEQDKDPKEWYAPFQVSKLGLILGALADLHAKGYVHGDMRLFNFLLHVGKLVDFDHTRKAGECCTNTLQPLEVDGKRAQAVS